MPNSAIGNAGSADSVRRVWPRQRGSAAPHECQLANRFGKPLHAGEPSVRIIMSVDEDCSALTGWASRLMDHPAFLAVDGIVPHDLSRMLRRCDVALVCSADEERLLNLIGACQRSVPHVAILAVVDHLSHAQRVGLFSAGVEDILSPNMDVREGAARVRGICQRLALLR